jgi:hypothetical protein
MIFLGRWKKWYFHPDIVENSQIIINSNNNDNYNTNWLRQRQRLSWNWAWNGSICVQWRINRTKKHYSKASNRRTRLEPATPGANIAPNRPQSTTFRSLHFVWKRGWELWLFKLQIFFAAPWRHAISIGGFLGICTTHTGANKEGHT